MDIYLQTRGHVQSYQRKVREWEQQQRQLHMEYKELVTRVEYLSDEVRNKQSLSSHLSLKSDHMPSDHP